MAHGDAYLLVHGRRIRQCYNHAKIRADLRWQRISTNGGDPIGSTSLEYQKFTEWKLAWYLALEANRDEAVAAAMAERKKEKACRRLNRRDYRRLNRALRTQVLLPQKA